MFEYNESIKHRKNIAIKLDETKNELDKAKDNINKKAKHIDKKREIEEELTQQKVIEVELKNKLE